MAESASSDYGDTPPLVGPVSGGIRAPAISPDGVVTPDRSILVTLSIKSIDAPRKPAIAKNAAKRTANAAGNRHGPNGIIANDLGRKDVLGRYSNRRSEISSESDLCQRPIRRMLPPNDHTRRGRGYRRDRLISPHRTAPSRRRDRAFDQFVESTGNRHRHLPRGGDLKSGRRLDLYRRHSSEIMGSDKAHR